MILQEYTPVLNYQTVCIDKTRKQINSYFNHSLVNVLTRTSSLKKKLTRLTLFFTDQLLASKGLIAVIEEKLNILKGRNLSETITDIDRLIKVYINLKDALDTIIANDEGITDDFPQLVVQLSILADTIDNLYYILRMLKRQNIKKGIETSQFARDSSRHSVNSLETVLHGRSST